ncbi:Unknown protein, partial [Striga hermonthica]
SHHLCAMLTEEELPRCGRPEHLPCSKSSGISIALLLVGIGSPLFGHKGLQICPSLMRFSSSLLRLRSSMFHLSTSLFCSSSSNPFLLQYSMESDYLSDICLGILLQFHSRLHWKKVCGLSQTIHDNPDRIVPTPCPRKIYYKVHCDVLPLSLGNPEWMRQTRRSLMFGLNSLTHQAVIDESRYISLETSPPERPFQVLIHLRTPWMNKVRVSLFNNSQYSSPTVEKPNKKTNSYKLNNHEHDNRKRIQNVNPYPYYNDLATHDRIINTNIHKQSVSPSTCTLKSS